MLQRSDVNNTPTWPIYSASVLIDRPQKDVFDYVIDRRHYHRWFPGIVEMVPADDLPIDAPGKKYAEIARGPTGKLDHLTPDTTAVDVPYSFSMDVDLQPVLPRFTYEFVPVGDTKTRFTIRCEATANGLLSMIARKVMRAVLNKRGAPALQTLKTILEARPNTLMRAAEVRQFGRPEKVFDVNPTAVRPAPGAGEILVRVIAASLNPIEAKRRSGYGRTLLAKKGGVEWPIILGSDFAGTVVSVGEGVNQFKLGDAVFGAKGVTSSGTYADYVCVSTDEVKLKPASVSFAEAAAMPYAFLTVWAAMFEGTGLSPADFEGKRVFVQGGAGGVGNAAIQLAQALGAYVATTCSTDAVELCEKLGADMVIDYQAEAYDQRLSDYDFALETVGGELEDRTLSILKMDGTAVYSTIAHPLLHYGDLYGFPRGLIKALREKARCKRAAKARGIAYHWSVFEPNRLGLKSLADMLENNRIEPEISRRFPLEEIAEAHQFLERGHARGKSLVIMDDELAEEEAAK